MYTYIDFLSVYFRVSLHSVAVPDIIYRLNFVKFCDTANWPQWFNGWSLHDTHYIPHQNMYNSVHSFYSNLRKLVFTGKTKQVKEITETECWLCVEKKIRFVLKAE